MITIHCWMSPLRRPSIAQNYYTQDQRASQIRSSTICWDLVFNLIIIRVCILFTKNSLSADSSNSSYIPPQLSLSNLHMHAQLSNTTCLSLRGGDVTVCQILWHQFLSGRTTNKWNWQNHLWQRLDNGGYKLDILTRYSCWHHLIFFSDVTATPL